MDARDRHGTALLADERPVAEGLEDALGGDPCLVRPGVGQDEGELVAAVAGRDVRRPQGGPDQLGGPGQHPVAEEVAERVVDELEVVEVEHHHAQRPTAALRPDDLLAQALVQEPVVVEAGQRVAVGELARLLVEPRVLERHRRLVGHRPGELEALVVPADLRLREQLDEADRLALGDERQHREHAQAVAGQQGDLGRVGGGILRVDDHRLLALEDAHGLGEPGDREERLHLVELEDRVVAERFDPAGGAVPVADGALVDAHGPGQVAGHEVRDLARVQALGQLAAHVEQAAQLAGQLLAAGQQPGRLDGRGRVVGEDRQQPQVVGIEAVETELRERDDADGDAVVAHRDDEHRFVDVVGAGDRRPARVAVGVVDQQRLAVLGDPAGEALAEPAAQELEVDVLVGADPALEGDRHDVVGRLDEVDPGVVVIDDPARLLDDGPTDRLDRRGPVEPARGRLQDRQLGGAHLGLLEQLGVDQGDPGVGRQGRDEGDVAVRPLARLAGHRRQGADDAVVVDERRDEVAGELHDALVPVAAVAGVGAGIRPGRRRARCAGPRRPSPRRSRTWAAPPRPRRAGRPRPRPSGGHPRGCGS